MVFIVLIEGGTSSGKSTIADLAVEMLRNEFSVAFVRQDNYYKDLTGLTVAELKDYNFDSPQAFDDHDFAEDIFLLQSGKAIKRRKYDFVKHQNLVSGELIEPGEIIICEGLFVFDLNIKADLKVFLDLDDDIRFIRRLQRDQEERSISPEETIDNYLKTVKPMHDKYIKPALTQADLVLKNNQEIDETVRLLVSEVKRRIK